MEEPLQAGLARFISGCSLEKIPEKFKADARLRILDWAGCAIAGAHYPQTVIAGRYQEIWILLRDKILVCLKII